MEADRKRLNKGEAPLHTFFVEELLNELHSHGPRTAERLARTLNLKSDGVIRLAKYMKRTITHTRRGAKLIS